MENLMNKILKILKGHVKENIKEIQYNQDEINHILSENAASPDMKDLDFKKALNRDLLDENKDFIKMQFDITEFIKKYGHLFTSDEEFEFEEKDTGEDLKLNLFYQTISGKLEFNQAHPKFNNPEFFRELFEYYKEKEDYEKCQELLKIKEYKN
jgi:septum formation topological specificity factor MinE